jgi:hypothetical protein
MIRFMRAAAVLMMTVTCAGCQSPSSASDTTDVDDIVDATISPNPAVATESTGKTYRIVRGNNQPDEVLPYQYVTTFTITVVIKTAELNEDEDLAFPVTVTAASGVVQQASAGILTPPTGGEVERYDSVMLSSTGTTVSAVGEGITMQFQVWYTLPSGLREALVTESISFKDDDGTTFTKVVPVKVAP